MEIVLIAVGCWHLVNSGLRNPLGDADASAAGYWQ